jgi:hypothetical protein
MSVAEIVDSVETLNREEWNQLWLMLEKKRAHDLAAEFKATLGDHAEVNTPLEAYEASASLGRFLESQA